MMVKGQFLSPFFHFTPGLTLLTHSSVKCPLKSPWGEKLLLLWKLLQVQQHRGASGSRSNVNHETSAGEIDK